MCCGFSRVQLFVTLWTVACQAPLSMRILQARILEWVAMPYCRVLPNPGIEPMSLTSSALAGRWVLYHWCSWDHLPNNTCIRTWLLLGPQPTSHFLSTFLRLCLRGKTRLTNNATSQTSDAQPKLPVGNPHVDGLGEVRETAAV